MTASAIQSVLSLLILTGIGYFIAGRSWYPSGGTDFLSKLCVRVAIPCHVFYNTITTVHSSAELTALFRGLPIPFLTILLSLGLGWLLAKVLRVDPFRHGVFLNAIAFCNSVLIGFAVVEAVFGAAALPDAMVYYMANTTLFWTIGTWLLRRDRRHATAYADRLASAAGPAYGSGPAAASQACTASLKADDCPAAAGPAAASALSAALDPLPALALPSASGRAAAIMDVLRSIFSPPLVGFLLGVVLVLANLKLPDFIFSPVSSLRQMTTPLAMIFIGAVIRGTSLKQARVSRDLAMVMAVRFLVTPVVMILILRSLPIGTQMRQVFFLMSTMPVMTQLGIMARESGSDCEYASVLVTVTTAFSLLAIPAYIYLLDRFHVF